MRVFLTNQQIIRSLLIKRCVLTANHATERKTFSQSDHRNREPQLPALDVTTVRNQYKDRRYWNTHFETALQ